jgi:hypothetical protein
VLRAQRRPLTRRGRWFWILVVAFFFAWLFGTDALLRAAGLPGRFPVGMRWLLVVVALTPFAIGYLSLLRPRLGLALGLIKTSLSRAVLDYSGIELSDEGLAPQRHRWDDISALEPAGKYWRLMGSDGSVLATIPSELVLPRPSWSDNPTLAEAVVQVRPDRYALRGGRLEPGLTEFALRVPEDSVGRVRFVTHKRVLGLGIVLFILANIALFWMLSQPR